MNDSVKDSVESMQGYVKKCAETRLSGTVVFTLHFRNGGVGRTQVETKEDLKAPNGRGRPDESRVRND